MKHYKSIIDWRKENGFPPPEHPMIMLHRGLRDFSLNDGEFTTDFYIVGFKKLKAGVVLYGRTPFDHSNGALGFIRPRQVIEFKNTAFEENGFLVIFHEDLLNGHFLFNDIKAFNFFDYEIDEALHLSPKEEQIMWDIYDKIEVEYNNSLDEYSIKIMLTHIHSMLIYSQRFYKRQFMNRTEISGKMVSRFNEVLNNYFRSEIFENHGIPSVGIMAAQLNLSPGYLSDMLRQETGKTALELIHIYLISAAKDRLKSGDLNVSEIAYSLGFENLPYFSRFFKKAVGISPNEFKKKLID